MAELALDDDQRDAFAGELPDAGLHSNGHTMMPERNSEQVADIVEEWIVEHVPGVRGRYRK
jgi:hypothetical protein